VRVLVTGGSGFIGSHVVDQLLAMGHEAVIFDLVASPHHSHAEVETVVGDILDETTLRAALRRCDAVIHLAAVADVEAVAANPARADLVNVRGTSELLGAARAAGVPRVLFGSTVWVYGDVVGAADVDEDVPLGLPSHFYTATKLAGEMYCRSYGQLFGLEETILRFGIPYGPRMREAAVLARFVRRAQSGEALMIAGDGSQSRQFVYVEDLAAGVVAALPSSAAGRIYNLVGRQSVTIRDVAEIVREIVGHVPILHVDRRAADLQQSRISGRRAARELGWESTTQFAAGARCYLEWLSDAHDAAHSSVARGVHRAGPSRVNGTAVGSDGDLSRASRVAGQFSVDEAKHQGRR
jgi:UDP-glucose 4-epimerase